MRHRLRSGILIVAWAGRIPFACVPNLFDLLNQPGKENPMKTATVALIFVLSASSIAFAQSGAMKPAEPPKAMDMHNCMDMKGMNMNDMDAEKCKAMMNAKRGNHAGNAAEVETHKASAVVQKIDRANGKVTLAHEAVQSLNWPAMTMGFTVQDKSLLDKLTVGKKVNVEFVRQGNDYVVTAVK
jgi:Cu(I)/Ag(I) efflux system protein CusF